ncbi:MAG: PHP domain-containing protein [Clostridia bacterium]|nr:PHP domain-containing protein [Clostridia bacterium]
MFESKVDYHIHTVYSDGTLTPVEVVKKYSEAEYDEIAITDHDGISGIAEAKIAGEALNIKVLPGIEISTDYEGHNVHLLGYNFDTENEALLEKLKEIRAARDERNVHLAEKINEMGFNFSLDEVYSRSKGKYVGKPNIARILVEKGYFPDFDTCFKELMESPEIRGLKKKRIPIEEAIRLIKDAKGLPVLAHPKKLKFLGEPETEEYWSNLDSFLRYLKKAGLSGMECFYPTHDTTDEFRFSSLAGKYHLHITKGSDFHGEK